MLVERYFGTVHMFHVSPKTVFLICQSIPTSVADLRGGARDMPPGGPNSFIFMRFLATKIG